MGSCFLLLLFTPLESNQLTHVLIPGWGGGGVGHSHVKEAGCSSSRRGVNFGLWCHLGCSRQNAIIFCRKGLFQGCKPRNIKKIIFSIRFIYSIYVIKVFQGSQKVGSSPVDLLQGFNSKFQTSIPALFIWESPPPGASDHYVRSMYYVTRSLI